MNRFIMIARKQVHNLWLQLCVVLFSLNLFFGIMSKAKKPNYISSEVKKLSEVDLKKALFEVKQKNLEIRESFKMDKETLAFRTGR
jgi:hypothetical protein